MKNLADRWSKKIREANGKYGYDCYAAEIKNDEYVKSYGN